MTAWLPPGPAEGAGGGGPWIDELQSRLFARRTVVIRGALDDALAGRAAAELMTLDATGDSHVTVHLDASGESLEAAFAVMDVIDLLGVPVHVLCLGRAEGTAVGILAVGARRSATPHARLRLADPRTSAQAPASELARWVEHHLDHLRRFHARVAAAVHRPIEEVAADFAAGRFMSAEDAVRYGLVDEVATARGAIYPLPGRSVGFRP